MGRFRGRRPSAATLIAVTALFVALGGTGYAAFTVPRNSVGTEQLKNNAVATSKISDRAVTASKINPRGLTVPNATHAAVATNATHAATAARLKNLVPLSYRAAANTAPQTVYTSPGGELTVTASCSSLRNITITLITSVGKAVLDSHGSGSSEDVGDTDFEPDAPLTFSNNSEQRTTVYTSPDGQIVTLIYAVQRPAIPGVDCLIAGTAVAT